MNPALHRDIKMQSACLFADTKIAQRLLFESNRMLNEFDLS